MYKLIARIYLFSFRATWGHKYNPNGDTDDALLGTVVLTAWFMMGWFVFAAARGENGGLIPAAILALVYWPMLVVAMRIVVPVGARIIAGVADVIEEQS
jgi:hypothetical protein